MRETGALSAAAARRRLDLSPEGHGGYELLCEVLLARGQPRAALEVIGHEPNEESRLMCQSLAFHALGRHADADAAFTDLRRRFTDARAAVADIHAYRGEVDRAFAALDEALAAGDPEVFAIKSDSYFVPLHTDPRYAAFVQKLNLPASGVF